MFLEIVGDCVFFDSSILTSAGCIIFIYCKWVSGSRKISLKIIFSQIF